MSVDDLLVEIAKRKLTVSVLAQSHSDGHEPTWHCYLRKGAKLVGTAFGQKTAAGALRNALDGKYFTAPTPIADQFQDLLG